MVTWDDDASAGAWIAERLGPFGPRVDGTVPRGYAAYACVPFPEAHGTLLYATEDGSPAPLDVLVDVLEPFTGVQPVHAGLWTGFSFLYDYGTDPRHSSGIGVLVGWAEDEPRPSEEEIAAAQAEAWDQLAPTLVERPAAPMLLLPHREHHLWTGTLADVAAFRHHGQAPSLWWPEDRSWFVGSDVDASAAYLGGSEALVDAVCAEPTLGAYRVAPSDTMLFEDD
jgi:hypothetical protein